MNINRYEIYDCLYSISQLNFFNQQKHKIIVTNETNPYK